MSDAPPPTGTGPRVDGRSASRAATRPRLAPLPLLALAALAALVLPSGAVSQDAPSSEPPTVTLPAELDAVLRAYERGWQARDAAALASLFTEDGFVLRPGHPPARGRAAIREAYANSGGPLALRAYDYGVDGNVAWIIGGYAALPELPAGGKYVLALRRTAEGWLIAGDMDNRNAG